MDYKGATSPLEQWAGLAVRDAKMRYREFLKEEERRYFEIGGVKKAGARIRMIEQAASDAILGLSGQFLAEAEAVSAVPLSVQKAQTKIILFFDYLSREALAMASYVRPTQSVIDATNTLIADLRSDFVDRTESFLSKRMGQVVSLEGSTKSNVAKNQLPPLRRGIDDSVALGQMKQAIENKTFENPHQASHYFGIALKGQSAAASAERLRRKFRKGLLS